jgi:hypothetical protein
LTFLIDPPLPPVQPPPPSPRQGWCVHRGPQRPVMDSR